MPHLILTIVGQKSLNTDSDYANKRNKHSSDYENLFFLCTEYRFPLKIPSSRPTVLTYRLMRIFHELEDRIQLLKAKQIIIRDAKNSFCQEYFIS